MKYIKKPVVIEAIQWNGINIEEIKEFAKEKIEYSIYDAGYKAGITPPVIDITIHTLEGDMKVSINDYIIKGVKGEIYPCKPDIFEETYELLESKGQ